ncbi:MAG: hypothetical protein RR060_04885 [Victivallaceae bacterium]
MSKRKILTTFAGGLAMIFFAGCNVNNVAVFDYTAAPEPMVQLSPHKVSVAMMPFEDHRAAMQSDANAGSLWWGFLPLAPFGRVITSTPESSESFVSLSHFDFNPPEDLGNAAFVSLKYANIFSELSRSFTPENTNADYLLYAGINSTNYAGYRLSYFVTYFLAPVPWVGFLPFGVSGNYLGLEFTLMERQSGMVVWKYYYNGDQYLTQWLYNGLGDDVSMYPSLMKRAMNGAILDLNQKLPQILSNAAVATKPSVVSEKAVEVAPDVPGE